MGIFSGKYYKKKDKNKSRRSILPLQRREGKKEKKKSPSYDQIFFLIKTVTLK